MCSWRTRGARQLGGPLVLCKQNKNALWWVCFTKGCGAEEAGEGPGGGRGYFAVGV